MNFLAASVRKLGVDIPPCKYWFLNKDTNGKRSRNMATLNKYKADQAE